jgi:hypothetical protein
MRRTDDGRVASTKHTEREGGIKVLNGGRGGGDSAAACLVPYGTSAPSISITFL